MSVTIKDVARVAGVSPSTVSRVISNSDSISDKTKKKVKAVMDELKYYPNINARSLVSKSSRIIGLVLPNNTDTFYQNPFFPTVLRGLNEIADAEEYSLLLSSANTEDEQLERIKTMVYGKQVDGLIFLYARLEDKLTDFLESIEFPFVVIGTPNKKRINSVDNDNEAMAYDLTVELIKEAGSNIAFVGGDQSQNFINLRYNGYRNALLDHGIELDNRYVFNDFQFLTNVGYDLSKELVALDELDGVIIADQLVARGVRAGWEHFGNKPMMTATFKAFDSQQSPENKEIYMDINAQELGRRSVAILLDVIQYQNVEGKSHRYYQEVVETELVKV